MFDDDDVVVVVVTIGIVLGLFASYIRNFINCSSKLKWAKLDTGLGGFNPDAY